MQTNLFDKRPSQKVRIYRLLKERGENGATNIELNEIAFRYGARIKDLRDEGSNIETKRLKSGLFKFILK